MRRPATPGRETRPILGAQDKNAEPRYQSLLKAQIPSAAMPGNAGTVRVIAGNYGGRTGTAKTFTPINLWDSVLVLGVGIRADAKSVQRQGARRSA